MKLDAIPEGITTRFAPSMTGFLHLGHVLHMIYVWGIAKVKAGKVIVRIEDHDVRPEAVSKNSTVRQSEPLGRE